MEYFDITIKDRLNELSIVFRKEQFDNKEDARSKILQDIGTIQDIKLEDSDLEWE